MGNAGKGQEQPPSSPLLQQPKQLSPLERWDCSEKSQDDLIALLSTVSSLEECTGTLEQFLRGIAKREKYQNYLVRLLDYLQSPPALERFPDGPRKQAFTVFSRRLRHSFFVAQDFPEIHMDMGQRPADKLCFLYEYYSLAEDLLQKALFFNYPTVFTGFAEFMRLLIENEVLVNEAFLCRFVVGPRRVEEMWEYFELALSSTAEEEREGLLADAAAVQDLKEVYFAGVEELLRYDYADAASSFIRNLQAKGYQLSGGEQEFWLKVEVYGVLLYELSKLSLGFDFLRGLSIPEVLHYFFTNYEVEVTPLLIRCFDVFSAPAEEWTSRISAYLFSPPAHTSTLIRLLQAHHLQLNGSPEEFTLLLGKLRGSRCEIGRYSEQLASLALSFDVDALLKANYCRLLKLVEIYHAFGINAEVEFLYGVVFTDWMAIEEGERGAMWERGLELLRAVIEGYFKSFEVKQRRVECEGEEFSFSSIFEMLRFVQFLKRAYLHDFITHCATHQVFFAELITHQRYVEIKALLSEERAREFAIEPETVGMIVTDHIICLLTSKPIRKTEESLRLLLSILGLSPSGNSWHYVLSYYHYLKYLQERDVVLPASMKENISTENLYFIATHFPLKLEQLDFNLLFAHQSCIKLHYTDTAAPFLPIVTDEFLKFKLFLCSKAFAGKRYKFGAEVVEEVVRYEPPWIGTELVRILRENPAVDDSFIAIAFNFCARGEDLEFILSLAASRGKQLPASNKLSLLKLRTWASLAEEERFIVLTEEVVVGEGYKDLVAELTFNEGGEVRSEHFLFFHLLTIEPERAFNYALNYALPPVFVVNFLLEGIKRSVLHLTNSLPFLLKFLFFTAKRDQGKGYVGLREYAGTSVEAIAGERAGEVTGNSYAVAAFQRMTRNYHAQRLASREFLDLYLSPKDLFKFLYEEPFRRDVLVGLREQPMSKANARVLRGLCERTGVDILELSLYNLTARANGSDCLDDESWTIVQKLAHWGDDPRIAASVLRRLAMRVESLRLLLALLDFLRESEPAYRSLASDYHLQVVRSLAAVETEHELFGVLPEDFFERAVGVRTQVQRGMLSESHRRVLREAACVENIFVLSKALYFIYGCSEEAEKVALGEFSLCQSDSEEFEELRKKIKREGGER